VISGSMGEAPHLVTNYPPNLHFPSELIYTFQSHSERQELIRAARETLDEAKLTNVPIVAGIGATSTRESIEFAKEAAAAGADYAIAISPSYYAGALIGNSEALRNYFVEIAEASPIPV
jgi:4-hydroxy-2-oxoglutarate aldolase